MKTWMLLLFSFLPSLVFAAGSSVPLDDANIDLKDKASLQRGAQTFMNYCSACHSMQYQRYERVADDLGIPASLMMDNLVFNPTAKIGDLMTNAIPVSYASASFGAPAPDLTLVARVRGVDWIYTYLRSFYEDPSRPFGVNNAVFPSVGMPHVLEELQGTPRKVYETKLVDGENIEEYVGIQSDGRGELNTDEYDLLVRDLVNFLAYSAEPMRLERERMGYWVMGFIVVFFILS